ncbi:MAG: BON domain-containing protein [Leptothrix sp. (in: Bacteria)]|nr:BON domain-containing protein [Leptothrix sp. (in: b-proteobacteria)]
MKTLMTPHSTASSRSLAARRPIAITLLGLALSSATVTLLSGCAPLIVGGAALGGALVATDRRSTGVQLDDQALEVRAGNRIREVAADRARVSVNAYNRTLLLTGEVHKDADKAAVEAAVAKLEDVKVVSEITVDWPTSSDDRSRDLLLASKVKSSFVETKGLEANAFSIVAHRKVIYLMGRVTESEARDAAAVASTVQGVQKVVRVLEVITPEQLNAIRSR